MAAVGSSAAAPPTWGRSRSSRPYYSVKLECVKNGVSLGAFEIEKSRWAFGRDADNVDTVLEHPSISRIHAHLQESVEGKWYIADSSSHGTRLNKAECPKGKYVPIQEGDVISFGGSARLFIVEGDTQHSPSTVRIPRAIQEEEAPMMWGQAEDATLEEEEEEPLPEYLAAAKECGEEVRSTLLPSERREKDMKILEKLDAKVKKANGVRRELARLSAKEDLSDGQRKVLERSQAKLLRLTDEILELEETIREKNAQRDGVNRSDRSRQEDIFESDMRDLTEKLPHARTEQERLERRKRRFVVAPTPLKKEDGKQPSTYEDMIAEKRSVQSELESARRIANALLDSKDKSQGGNDSLEKFLSGNDERRRREVADTVARDISRLEERQRDLDRLIAIAKPAHLSFVGRDPPATKSTQAPPKLDEQILEKESSPPTSLDAPRLQEKRMVGPQQPTISEGGLSATVRMLASSAKRDAEADVQDDGHERFEPKKLAHSTSRTKEAKRRKEEDPASHFLQGGDQAWVPPSGQDGSGRTKLNDLLGY